MAGMRKGGWAGSRLFSRAIGLATLVLSLISFSSVADCLTLRHALLHATRAHPTGHHSIVVPRSDETYPVDALAEGKLEEEAAATTVNKYKADEAREKQDDEDEEAAAAVDDRMQTEDSMQSIPLDDAEDNGDGDKDTLGETDFTAEKALDTDDSETTEGDAGDDNNGKNDSDEMAALNETDGADDASLADSYLEENSNVATKSPDHSHLRLVGRKFDPPSKFHNFKKAGRVIKAVSRMGAEYAKKGLKKATEAAKRSASRFAHRTGNVAKKIREYVAKHHHQ
ncbi:hypothetical protein, conserved [Babesia ovata]|uniref:Uncharacterized protein n=1 Tax=Babesia ovata TaxID=189622 RepID=A0A2H6K9G3_9APIC|nr:uncharacterized protein BOVATA_011290 [Babesia ovata]GBE59636.1 hypothetical protein, conserved [Babesia ovata]